MKKINIVWKIVFIIIAVTIAFVGSYYGKKWLYTETDSITIIETTLNDTLVDGTIMKIDVIYSINLDSITIISIDSIYFIYPLVIEEVENN